MSFLTGILAAFIGIGGGLLLIPLMIDWGLPSMAAAATSGFFVVFTSFISLFLVLISGDVSIGEVGYFFILAFVGSILISGTITHLSIKYNKSSVVMSVLLILIIISAVVLPIFAIIRGVEDKDTLFAAGSVCK
mmetsp:Transcript_1654/g.2475  ORF Transcript_1654/g.2475 Transcript_1654/m.2475 type:complete len:134 (+) Transcript_1654:166-567(+)